MTTCKGCSSCKVLPEFTYGGVYKKVCILLGIEVTEYVSGLTCHKNCPYARRKNEYPRPGLK